jgi:hypothetical protein
MGLIELVVILIVVGMLLWLVTQLPLDPTIQNIIRGVVILVVVLWLLRLFVGDLPLLPIRAR